MKIIIGHANMDLDCFGSIALVKYIYPDHQPVKSQLVHPSARKLYNLYQYRFNFLSPKDLKGEKIEQIVVVDTNAQNRVKEFFKYIEDFEGEIEVWDHHPSEGRFFEQATYISKPYGANTTLIGMELIKRGIKIEPEDATIALSGIYADTGGFLYENVTNEDFKVASYLIENGASIPLVREFLKILTEKRQISLFHDILNRLTYKYVKGHFIILSYIEIEEQVGGMAAVIEKIFEVERAEAIFCVFHVNKKKQNVVIARSNTDSINVNELLQQFNGGGHIRAASALVKNQSGMMVIAELEECLENSLKPALMASDIMEDHVEVIKESMSLLEASTFLEEIGHTGAPVVSGKGELTGFMTLRDIMKGRKNDQMQSSVTGYMSKNVITGTRDITIRDVEELLFEHNIGHLPIVQGRAIIGMITRTDYLRLVGKSGQDSE
ncbi:MAG: CBS domain-containing protein [Phycisphaerales bacterium]|jgi:tRNA nucleotidyltransferase (CCA-adding enzyme)|nr:CBS domain-containing protein [Phycisphaerales bacterium]